MSRTLSLELPEQVERALVEEAARTGKSREQIALEWIESRLEQSPRGSVDAILPSYGAWSMTPEERAEIERTIEEDRLLEDADQ